MGFGTSLLLACNFSVFYLKDCSFLFPISILNNEMFLCHQYTHTHIGTLVTHLIQHLLGIWVCNTSEKMWYV